MSVPTILQNIVARKHEEVAERSARVAIQTLEQMASAASATKAASARCGAPGRRLLLLWWRAVGLRRGLLAGGSRRLGHRGGRGVEPRRLRVLGLIYHTN